MRKASIKETGEELSQAEWERFDAAVARLKAEREDAGPDQAELALFRDGRSVARRPCEAQG